MTTDNLASEEPVPMERCKLLSGSKEESGKARRSRMALSPRQTSFFLCEWTG
jgi:hypothetical protein